MTSAPPQIITRALTFNFAPSVSTTTGLPDILDIAITPLGDGSSATSGATYAGGVKDAQIELSQPLNTIVFNLIPSYSPGLNQAINYRVMWRIGVMGRTETTDFAMPDADLTWDQLISTVSNIIGGQAYLEQTDLGVPGRVARLDNLGIPITAAGVQAATTADVAGLNASLGVETVAREAADSALSSSLSTQIGTQTSATLNNAKAYTDNNVVSINADITVERTARIAADADLQSQITGSNSDQGTLNTGFADDIATINDTLPQKADLVGGTVPVAQIPEEIITSAVSVPNQAAMLALTSPTVHKGDLAVRPDGVFLLTTDDPSVLSNWIPLSVISSVNSQTGAVVLAAADVGAIPVGGTIAQSQVTGLGTTLSSKANQTDLATAQAALTAIQTDTTLVHTSAGVVPTTLMSTDMVYLNASGQLVKKDGTIIPLGTSGSGAVFSVNSQTGIVVLTAASVGAVPVGGSIAQSQVTGLATTLTTKADLSGPGNTVPVSQLPSIPQTQVTGLATTFTTKADLVGGLIPLAEIPLLTTAKVPALPQTQITGLPALISGNQLASGTNAVNRIASLESQVAAGGGTTGGGIGTQAVFYTSPNTTTPVTASDLSTVTNLNSPWGIDSDGTITGTVGTWYFLYTGVRGSDVAYPFISQNGHLQLHKWNEAGPADPVYALASDLTTTNTTVAAKANQTDLLSLTATVATKANQSDLTALSATVDTKATIANLNATNTAVATKANQSDLTTTNATVATKANQSDLSALTTTVGTKANQSDLTTNTNAVAAINAALPTKADLVSGVLKSTQIPTAIPQANVTNLVPNLAAKADLVSGVLALAQVPTNIPQASIVGLGTTLGAKADLVGGTVPLSQLPAAALPNIVVVANQAAMLALTTAQVQYGDMVLITGTTAKGTYVLTGTDPSQLVNWTELVTPAAPVTSVNTQTGAVVLQAVDVGALAANASIPITQVTGLSTQLSSYATTTAMNTALSAKTAFSDIQNMFATSSFVKRADYVATAPIASLSGQQSVDGVLVPNLALVHATAQPSSVNNGLWIVAAGGNWTRPADFATGSWLAKDTVVIVNNQTASAPGTSANNTIWQETAVSGFIDTAANSWLKIGNTAPPFTPVHGNGIAISGSTFSAVTQTGGGLINGVNGLAADPNVTPRKFVGSVPAGSTVAGVTHNLNTTTPVVSIWQTGSNTLVLAGVTVTSANSISIEFSSAPATGQYLVCVIG